MSKYSREQIAQVVAACDIVDVIGSYLDLKPAGSNRYKALSPFTNEKTPSFMVSRDRQMYHCFSSGRGGDVLRFIMDYEGLSFNEALQKLADRAGIRLESSNREYSREEYLRKRVLELNTFAAKFYRRQLVDPITGHVGREYLKQRQLKDSTVARFELGLALDGFDQLRDAALKQGFRESELVASGLVRRGEYSLYDFFRNRLIIPIKDISGNVVAFGGRDLGDNVAKYINSPETLAYKKSRVLYGLLEARDALRREGKAILVEGYFDLMRCFDAGIENVVATCGTALTDQQAMLIKRYASEVVVVYDGDVAGIRAALRGIGILVGAGLTVSAMTPPKGKDPDDCIRELGVDIFRQEISQAKDFVQFYIDMNQELLRTIEGKTQVAHALFAILRTLNEHIRVEEYLQKIAEGLNIHVWECKREFERYCKNHRLSPRVESLAAITITGKEKRRLVKDDVDFIAALLAYREFLEMVNDQAEEIESNSPVFALARRLSLQGCSINVNDLPEEEQCLYSAAVIVEPQDILKSRQIVEERLARFKRDLWVSQLEEFQQQMRKARRDKDENRAAELYERILELKQRLEALNLV